LQSIWRAVCRKAAEHGGHPTLLAEAMVDPAFALTMREEQGKLVFERDGQGKVIKASGRILTLTAREAVDCRLAERLAPDLKTVGQHLGMPEWQQVGGRPGEQPGDTGAPEMSASDACATPDSLYDMLYRKVVSLGLTDELTELQAEKAREEWDSYFKAQKFAGRRVRWNVTLTEAREREIEKVVHGHTYEPGKIGHPIKWTEKQNLVDFLKERLQSTISALKSAEKELRGGPPPKGCPWRLANPEEVVRRNRAKVAELRRRLKEAEAYPIKVTAKCDNEPRVSLVAWVSRNSKGALADVAPESEIVLSGKIGEVVPHLSHDGIFVIEVILDQCVLAQERATPSPVGDKDADRDCRGWLSMARNYLRAGMPEKAIPYLKQVIERYGDTRYAKQARDLRQEALQMIKARSEQEETPSGHEETKPDMQHKRQ